METNYKDIQRCILLANSLKVELMKAGLVKTFRKMDAVTKEIGWEAYEILQGKHTTKLKSRKRKS